jgi:hypothetical protein
MQKFNWKERKGKDILDMLGEQQKLQNSKRFKNDTYWNLAFLFPSKGRVLEQGYADVLFEKKKIKNI